MNIRIIIDTEDAGMKEAANTPFTLNAYSDGDDGTPGQEPLSLGGETAIIGNSIPGMLQELGRAWQDGYVVDQDDVPLPRDGDGWRAQCKEEEDQG